MFFLLWWFPSFSASSDGVYIAGGARLRRSTRVVWT